LEFIVLKDSSRGYVVKRKNGKYEEHAHLKTMNGCRQLLYYIKKGMLPKSEYLQGSCRRLLTTEEYDRLKKPKDRYYNRGGRKVERK